MKRHIFPIKRQIFATNRRLWPITVPACFFDDQSNTKSFYFPFRLSTSCAPTLFGEQFCKVFYRNWNLSFAECNYSYRETTKLLEFPLSYEYINGPSLWMNRTTLMHVLHSQLGRHLKSNLEADIWPPGDDMQSRSMCLPIIYLFLPSLPLLHVHDGVKGKKLTHISYISTSWRSQTAKINEMARNILVLLGLLGGENDVPQGLFFYSWDSSLKIFHLLS